jgi:hypothetical protein
MPPQSGIMETFQLCFCLLHGDEELEFRSVTLSAETPSLILGRSSKDESKALLPAAGNLWLTSPVISRSHARFALSMTDVGTVPFLIITVLTFAGFIRNSGRFGLVSWYLSYW